MAGEPRHAMTNRLEGAWVDAGLHLLDRQVVDVADHPALVVENLPVQEVQRCVQPRAFEAVPGAGHLRHPPPCA